ncbi:MAG: hypothetical protein R3C11_22875 [Planctomycetaceae bacterium]
MPLDRDSQIEVTTVNGREIRGYVDSRTNSEELILTIADNEAQVTSHLPWRVISTVRLGGYTLTLAELQNQLPALQQEFNMRPAFGGWTAEGIHISQEIPASISEPLPAPPLPESELPATPRRVTSLDINADVANWDRDPERDGILLEVRPLDNNGDLIPVDGQVECELIIEHKTWEGGEYISRLPERFEVVARWTQPIQQTDFRSSGVTLKLPYRVRHPESDLLIDPDALVHARLKVPGEGVFTASYEIVRLRPFSSIRDEFQLYEGNRYFPQERTRFVPRRKIDH